MLSGMPDRTAKLVRAYPPTVFHQAGTTVSLLYKGDANYAVLSNIGSADAAMSPRAVEKALQRIGERAGETRRIYPHLMRHTFATNALHGGMDITTIQHLLGHSDPKTTLIYAELRPDAIRYAYEKVIA